VPGASTSCSTDGSTTDPGETSADRDLPDRLTRSNSYTHVEHP
jgi:hypothetical protein